MATGPRSAGMAVAGEEVALAAARWRRAHLTVGERVARGRAGRTGAPRSAHGRDFAAFTAAVSSGRLIARTGV